MLLSELSFINSKQSRQKLRRISGYFQGHVTTSKRLPYLWVLLRKNNSTHPNPVLKHLVSGFPVYPCFKPCQSVRRDDYMIIPSDSTTTNSTEYNGSLKKSLRHQKHRRDLCLHRQCAHAGISVKQSGKIRDLSVQITYVFKKVL